MHIYKKSGRLEITKLTLMKMRRSYIFISFPENQPILHIPSSFTSPWHACPFLHIEIKFSPFKPTGKASPSYCSQAARLLLGSREGSGWQFKVQALCCFSAQFP
jgi:hypothetical protein